MILIVGLGNPGKEYEKTRHNVGFMAIDAIAANFQFPIFNFQSISNAQISKNRIGDEETILAKPQTFMNESGKTVKSLIKNYKMNKFLASEKEIKNLFVVHDDIDLPIGEFKIQTGKSSAGHKGVQSIIDHLGTKDFWRVRIGICPLKSKPEKVEEFVLKNFTKDEETILKKVIEDIVEQIKSRG